MYTLALAILLSLSALPAFRLNAQTQPAHTEPIVKIPYSAEVHVTQTWTAPARSSTTQERTELNEFDAYGRSVFASRAATSGITSFHVEDPISGVTIVWNTAVPLAKVLYHPNPVPGRQSCWRVTPEDAKPEIGDPQIGLGNATCLPAGQHQFAYCKQTASLTYSRGVRESIAEPLPTITVSRPTCKPAAGEKTVEDLGTATIAGYDTQGCRAEHTAGMEYISSWSVELIAGRLRRNVWVRSEQQNSSGVKTLMELNNLSLTTPDPKAFQAPEGYQIKNIRMVEVDCTPNPASPK